MYHSPISNDHDSGYKFLFSTPELVRDPIIGFVPDKWLHSLDYSTLERVPGSYVAKTSATVPTTSSGGSESVANGPKCRQAGLGEYTGDAVAMHVQLGRDGADTPAFGVVITQDLRFNLGAESHVFSGRVGDGESDAAESPGAPRPARDDDNDSSALAGVRPATSVQRGVDQEQRWVGNPDALLSVAGPGNDAGVRRGRDGRAGSLDSGDPKHPWPVGVPRRHSAQCSSAGHDHSGCK
ncbi:MAG: hypothetical protein V5B40_21495 [Candidatus Accumulibacter meliphilus]